MHIRILNTKKEKVYSFVIGKSIETEMKKLSKEQRNLEIQDIASFFVKTMKPKEQPEKWTWEQYTPVDLDEVQEQPEETPKDATSTEQAQPAVEAPAQT